MRRREFILALGGAASVWPFAARAASCENPDAPAPSARWVLHLLSQSSDDAEIAGISFLRAGAAGTVAM